MTTECYTHLASFLAHQALTKDIFQLLNLLCYTLIQTMDIFNSKPTLLHLLLTQYWKWTLKIDKQTSLKHFDMNGIWEGSVSYGREGQHSDSVGLGGHQTLNGGDHAVLYVVDLPHAHGLRWVHGVVHPITLDLSIGLLGFIPAYHHGVLGNDTGLDVSWWAGGSLLPSPSFDWFAGWALANGVEGWHADLVIGVRRKSSNAVASGGDGVHGLELALGRLGTILDDVMGDGLRVATVPGDGDTGGGSFCYDGSTWRFRQSCSGG